MSSVAQLGRKIGYVEDKVRDVLLTSGHRPRTETWIETSFAVIGVLSVRIYPLGEHLRNCRRSNKIAVISLLSKIIGLPDFGWIFHA